MGIFQVAAVCYAVNMTRERKVLVFAWGLSVTVTLIAFIAWGDMYSWKLSNLTLYQIFPLLGLLAFSLMWAHYIASVVRQHFGVDKAVLRSYFEITSSVVLAAILLHPSLLALQLWIDGKGLPPFSEINYVVSSARWAIFFGFTALTVFLSYEFRRWYGTKPWWKFVEYASDAAMILIFFHALKLGGTLMTGWFRTVWYFYGVTLLGALIYIYLQKYKRAKLAK